MKCLETGLRCPRACKGPVNLKTETVGSIEGNSSFVMYEVVSISEARVCPLTLASIIQPTDWVYDEINVTGRTFENSPAQFLPDRVLHITK